LDGDHRQDLTEHLVDCADCRADALAAEGTRWGRSVDEVLVLLAQQVEPDRELLSPCPGPVVVAAWSGGDRTPGLIEHWADCAPCRADLLAAAQVDFERSIDLTLASMPWRESARVAGGCPSPDAIANRVEAGELGELEDHLSVCEPCRDDALAAAAALAAMPIEHPNPEADAAIDLAPDPEAELEPELAQILSFSRRSRRLRRVALPTRHAGTSSPFAPAVAIAAAVLLAVFVFALRPTPPGAQIASADVESSRFAWQPEAPEALDATQAQAPAAPDQDWAQETEFEPDAWIAWARERQASAAEARPEVVPPVEPPSDPRPLDSPTDPEPHVAQVDPPQPSTTTEQRVRPVEREPEPELARVAEVEAQGVRVRRDGKRLREVARLDPGDRIFASRSGGAVRSSAGLTLYLAPRAEVRWRDDGVELVRGRAYVQAPGGVKVTTRGGSVDVNGEVLLAVKGRQAGVQVVTGAARYQYAKGHLDIASGKSAVISPRRARLQPALPQAPQWLADVKGNLGEPLPPGLGGQPLGPGFPPPSGLPPPPGGHPPPPGGPPPSGDAGLGRGPDGSPRGSGPDGSPRGSGPDGGQRGGQGDGQRGDDPRSGPDGGQRGGRDGRRGDGQRGDGQRSGPDGGQRGGQRGDGQRSGPDGGQRGGQRGDGQRSGPDGGQRGGQRGDGQRSGPDGGGRRGGGGARDGQRGGQQGGPSSGSRPLQRRR